VDPSRGQSPRAAGCRRQRQPRQQDTLAVLASRIEAEYGDSLGALHYIAVAIHNNHDSGNPTNMRIPMATLCTVLDRMGRYEPAATIAGFASLPSPRRRRLNFSLRQPICALSSVTKTTNRFARKGETMSTAEIATYAYDQIDQARTALDAVSE
jgi:hypothetical protein